MDSCHSAAVSQGDVVELLGEPSGDAGVEAHELIGGVVAGPGWWAPRARRRKLDPALSLCHSPLQPVTLPSDGW